HQTEAVGGAIQVRDLVEHGGSHLHRGQLAAAIGLQQTNRCHGQNFPGHRMSSTSQSKQVSLLHTSQIQRLQGGGGRGQRFPAPAPVPPCRRRCWQPLPSTPKWRPNFRLVCKHQFSSLLSQKNPEPPLKNSTQPYIQRSPT